MNDILKIVKISINYINSILKKHLYGNILNKDPHVFLNDGHTMIQRSTLKWIITKKYQS